MMQPLAEKYLRQSALPTLFCPGCGDGTVLSAFLRAIDELDVLEDLALVGGIGCSGWIPVYVDADTIHALHGRAIAVATGLKMTGFDRKVVVFTGDGDCLAMGGNHFIHACRRNIDMTVIMINNAIYGMTGGQMAPTTAHGVTTQTSPYGNPERPLDACGLAISAGSTYVARWTAGHPVQLTATMREAILHPGFAFIEVMTQCPTQAGRHGKAGMKPPDIMSELRLQVGPGAGVEIGCLHREIRPEFSEVYRGLMEGDGRANAPH